MTTPQSGPFRRSPLITLWILCALRAGAVGSTIALGSLVETELNAFCRGYQGSVCGGRNSFAACSEGMRARAHREETGGARGNQAGIDDIEQNRRLVEQLPRLPPEANLLLGHWRNVPAPAPINPSA